MLFLSTTPLKYPFEVRLKVDEIKKQKHQHQQKDFTVWALTY